MGAVAEGSDDDERTSKEARHGDGECDFVVCGTGWSRCNKLAQSAWPDTPHTRARSPPPHAAATSRAVSWRATPPSSRSAAPCLCMGGCCRSTSSTGWSASTQRRRCVGGCVCVCVFEGWGGGWVGIEDGWLECHPPTATLRHQPTPPPPPAQHWMLHGPATPKPRFLSGRTAVVWARHYSAEDEARCDCDALHQALAGIPGAERMVGAGGWGGGRVMRVCVHACVVRLRLRLAALGHPGGGAHGERVLGACARVMCMHACVRACVRACALARAPPHTHTHARAVPLRRWWDTRSRSRASTARVGGASYALTWV